MMGGDVTVTSEMGKGSVFTLRLPGALIKGSGGKRAGGTPPRFRTIQRHPKDLRALPVHPEPAAGVRTPMALGDTYCRGLRRPADRPECRCHRGCPSNKSTLVERSLCSIPWQGDFPSRNVPTIKDALRSVHWKLDDRPKLCYQPPVRKLPTSHRFSRHT
jgi:hypothetical protein